MVKTLLIIAHTPSPNTIELVRLGLLAITQANLQNIECELISPFDASTSHIAKADGIVLFTTENFGYMSGALKDMFDRTYIDCLDNTQGKPYGLIVRAGTDGTGTVLSVNKILTGLKWQSCQHPLVLTGKYDITTQDDFHRTISEYMLTIAAGLDSGIF